MKIFDENELKRLENVENEELEKTELKKKAPEDSLDLSSLSFSEQRKEHRRREKEKIKTLHGKERLHYLFMYYRSYIFATLGILVFLIVGAFLLYPETFDTKLYIIVSNNLDDGQTGEYLTKNLTSFLELGEKEKIMVNDSFLLKAYDTQGKEIEIPTDKNGMNMDYGSYEYMEKVIAMVQNGELDLLLSDQEYLTYFAGSNSFVDLSTFLPDDLYEELKDDLVMYPSSDGTKAAYGISLKNSRLLKDVPECALKNPTLGVSVSAPNPENVIKALRYLFSE